MRLNSCVLNEGDDIVGLLGLVGMIGLEVVETLPLNLFDSSAIELPILFLLDSDLVKPEDEAD